MLVRWGIKVRGVVQGVGFRPFVFSLATKHRLFGRVWNDQEGVHIDVEGDRVPLEQFLADLKAYRPALSQIDQVEVDEAATSANYSDFRILASTDGDEKFVPIPADVATCADCLSELSDPLNRRFRYPFINCTNCGPRFTIIEDVPYDRASTTMSAFEMCAACRAEYENPADRRFHAEPIACAECGPHVWLVDKQTGESVAAREDALNQTIALLKSGKILAIKGIGGFHLACDALNEDAVIALRQRKYREDKPFALMARSVDIIAGHCELSSDETILLCSIERPIVLLRKLKTSPLSGAVAPRLKTLGFMLPYAPVHHLLLEQFDGPLVMTSANISDEPICYEDEDARRRLGNIADYYLMHNRRIHMRADDSVARVVPIISNEKDPHAKTQRRKESQSPNNSQGLEMLLRRSRGFAPKPIKARVKFERQILACGAELKNTFCLTRDNYAFVSHHIGDLENLETLRSFTEGIEHFKKLFYLDPSAIAYDLHPEYLSTKYALAREDIETRIGVQHHHAHIASCMVDNQIEGDVIGVAMDGLGFGVDGRLWGGEFLLANLSEAERLAHLEYVPMPGGEKAIREPWRMAAVYLQHAFGADWLKLGIPFVAQVDQKRWTTLKSMTVSGTNSPDTSSMGRLFDAVASLVGLRDSVNYEGQAAVELESICDIPATQKYNFDVIDDGSIISAEQLIREAVADLVDGVPPAKVSAKFHASVAELIATMARLTRLEHQLNRVVLSGGVFQNMILLNSTRRLLADDGFDVFIHHRVPPNDGGISLGQAAVANARIAAGTI